MTQTAYSMYTYQRLLSVVLPCAIALILIGFFPIYLLARHFAAQHRLTRNEALLKQGKTLCMLVAVVVVIVTALTTALVTGSFNASSVANTVEPVLSTFIIAAVPVIIGELIGARVGFDLYRPVADKWVRSQQLAELARQDPIWNEEYMLQGVRNVFRAYQRDWSNLNIAATRSYLTPRYHRHVELMMRALRDTGRRNKVTIRRIEHIEIGSFVDMRNNERDRFEAVIFADVTSQLIDVASGRIMDNKKLSIMENWQFQRHYDTWLLNQISPLVSIDDAREADIQLFANRHGAYYSLHWGRVLLPTRGQIFGSHAFRTADVSNYVIGQMKSTGRATRDDAVYQIYTYVRRPYMGVNPSGEYLIGQMPLPKEYGNIVVRRRQPLQPKIRGLHKIEIGYDRFNDKYDVYAESKEQVTVFELLHPVMIQTLIDIPFPINLEVIDRAVYFYVPLYQTNADNYSTMLKVLQAAYRELKI